ncbi:hypothetical protein CB0940_01943 [Cercospora beticola]|uniref:EthD domain-containing protein n=1 Tax=Cercospora beticola TaxID=122368 RepID=A0A2G5I8L6_CERBT|nr:hypothetical protein CB0940_01943 [Cercospora beticola]PIB00844.1 hypothetical protein CB0940_01943 [Cercospora beticola]WPA97407.1 hypothetical protein RHO25_002017 [Cercospora beticola]CAK1354159.1 unnamed protein product [Cercospora beticola]
MAPATVTVVYPQGAKFNMDYYKSTHMPLVQEKWGKHGLKSWKVIQFSNDSPYCVQATLEWDSLSDFQKAGGSPEAKDVMADIPNFSDKEPVIMAGEVQLTS